MKKWLLTSGIVAALYFGFQHIKGDLFAATSQFFKENFSIRISNFKIHRLSSTGIDIRLSTDINNLSSLSATAEDLKADVFILKDGAPSHLATTTIKTKFTIKARDTTRISDIKLVAPLQSILFNLSVITAASRPLRVVVSTKINGKQISLTKNLIV